MSIATFWDCQSCRTLNKSMIGSIPCQECGSRDVVEINGSAKDAQIASLEAKVKHAMAWIDANADHQIDCAAIKSAVGDDCDCGYEEIIAELSDGKK